MHAPTPQPIFTRSSEQESWLSRVSENFQQLLMPIPLKASSPNGAPLHVVDMDHGQRGGRPQICSMLVHTTAIALLLYVAAQSKDEAIHKPGITPSGPTILRYVPPRVARLLGDPSPGRKGGSGDENPIPTTRGTLAPFSSMQFLSPQLPQNEKPELPVPVAIFDAEAPPSSTSVAHLGLPWMQSETSSPGPGKNHGIGTGTAHTMGDEDGDGVGFGNDGRPYSNVASFPVCTYCPDPSYTEDARKGKLQGTVTLRILVTADGRAAQVRLVKGLSGDLDERAAQTVRSWRFIPAKDAARRSVPAWMTVEVLYRLF
jgi:protein TonB